MKLKWLLAAVACIVAVSAGGYGLYRFGMERGMQMGAIPADAGSAESTAAPTAATQTGSMSIAQGEEATRRHISTGVKAGDVDPVNGKKVLYYHDPMVPGNRFDKPAKSPFMDMMLVPVYVDSGEDGSKVIVSPRTQQNLGVRTAVATEGRISRQVQAIGSIVFNERDQVIVQARATGYVERLHVRATFDRVVRGQPLAELFVPEWIAAQEEFLSVRSMKGNDLAPIVEGARHRMRQLGMNDVQIAQVENSGRSQPRITLTAPSSGVITELMAREGMTVAAGSTLFRINGLDSVWANAEVPESQVSRLRVGGAVQASTPAAPDLRFQGKVQAILPNVDQVTRTIKVRLELKNPARILLPGMFVQMQFRDDATEKSVQIPSEAIIQTGKRVLVMLAEEKGGFRPIEVEIGVESDGQTEIKQGLKVGERVVVSSQFLIDSEASLKGVEARLNAVPKPDGAPAGVKP